MEQQIQSLELAQRQFYLSAMPSISDEELAVWMLVETDLGISRILCQEWLSRHPAC